MQVPAPVVEAFTELRMKSTHRYMIMKISDDRSSIEIEHLGEKEATFDEFKAKVIPNSPRFIIYDLCWKTDDGRAVSKICFINYNPDGEQDASDLRFICANAKEAVKAKLNPTHREFQINDYADIKESEWIEEF
jgi:hypothetical protein